MFVVNTIIILTPLSVVVVVIALNLVHCCSDIISRNISLPKFVYSVSGTLIVFGSVSITPGLFTGRIFFPLSQSCHRHEHCVRVLFFFLLQCLLFVPLSLATAI